MNAITIAAIQPRSGTGDREHENAPAAVGWIGRAAEAGADLVVFPEGYPGPTNPAHGYDGIEPLRDAARAHGVHVIAGTIEPTGDGIRLTERGALLSNEVIARLTDFEIAIP